MQAAALVGIFKQAVVAWWDDNVMQLGAALPFYTLFAIAPVLIVAISLSGRPSARSRRRCGQATGGWGGSVGGARGVPSRAPMRVC